MSATTEINHLNNIYPSYDVREGIVFFKKKKKSPFNHDQNIKTHHLGTVYKTSDQRSSSYQGHQK